MRGRITDKNVEMETGGLRMIKRIEETLKTGHSAVFGGGVLF